MSAGGQLCNLIWQFPTIVLRTSSVDPVGSGIGEENRVAPHRPGASKWELQPRMEPSVGEMDAVPRPVLSARPDGPDSDGASRIGVDTDRNHFLCAPGDGYIRHVSGYGLFGDGSCPLVPFNQDLVPAHLPDQLADWQAGLRIPLRSRAACLRKPLPSPMGEDLSQLYLAPRSRSRRSTRRAPAGKNRPRVRHGKGPKLKMVPMTRSPWMRRSRASRQLMPQPRGSVDPMWSCPS